jgi:periplasmic protein CpxP/Spy
MKMSGKNIDSANLRLMTAVTMVITLIFAPWVVFAVNQDAPAELAELRITDIRQKLKITPAQEEAWNKVEQVMREEAKIMDTLTQARTDHANELSAVADLKSYAEIAEAHAAGIRRLIPLFTALYDQMSNAQKKDSDTLFRQGYHNNPSKK